ncbi:MAG: hypothetical protein AMXMBFR7_17270 [Planctomycetota bacterium]
MSLSGLRVKRREAVAEMLVEAAEQVISEKGYDRATMQDIATAAGCATGTLYLYFKTKEELFNAMVAKHCSAIVELAQAAMDAQTSPVGKLRAKIEATTDYFERHPQFYRVFYVAGPTVKATIQQSLHDEALEVYQALRQAEAEVVAAGQRQGVVRSDIAADELVDFMHALCVGTTARWITTGRVPPRAEQTRLLWAVTSGMLGIREEQR